MFYDFMLKDDYLDYLENIPADDRDAILKLHIKHLNLDLTTFELFVALKNRDINKIKGRTD